MLFFYHTPLSFFLFLFFLSANDSIFFRIPFSLNIREFFESLRLPLAKGSSTSKADAPILSEFAARVEFFRLQN